jgi:predicted aspartyl protease
MEICTMGRVAVTAKVENYADLQEVELGLRKPEDVRSITVDDALVDTGATMFSLPKRLVAQLGLRRSRAKSARTPAGIVTFHIYQPVTLTIQGRDCFTEVCEIPDECPVLIGQIPLEVLDFVVDPVGQQLIGNPAHGGQQMIELF